MINWLNGYEWRDCRSTLRAMFTTLRRSDIHDLWKMSLKYFQYTFHWMILYDDLSDITWNLWRNKLRSIFSKQRGFVNGPDLVAQSTGKPLKSANKNTELHKSCLEMGTLLQTAMILLKCPFIQHISSWLLVIFLSYYWTKYDSTCKGSEQTFLTRTSVLWLSSCMGLGYNKVGCGHGSRTWQLTQQAACPSFARNHWLE